MKFLKKYFDILKYIYSFSHTYIFLILFVKIFNFFTTYAMLYLGRILLNSISRSISESKLEINRLIIVIFIVLIFEVLTTLFYNISQYFIGKIILRYNDALTIKMATQISSLDMSYFDNPEHYNKLRQASSVSNSIMNIFNGSIDLIFACFSLVFYFFICLKFNIFITLIALLSVIPGYIINKKIQVCNYDMEKSIIPNKRYVDYLLSIFYNRNTEMELKIYNFSDFIIRKVDNTQKEYRDKKIKFSRKAAIWESLLFVFNKVCYYCNSIFIILCIIKNKLTIGDYTYYNGIVLNLSSSLKSSINLINNIYINFIKYNDYCSILERKPLIDTSGNININTSKIEIEFYHVSFKYPNTDNWTLKDITFKFTSGDKIALVGLNGAGKSKQ